MWEEEFEKRKLDKNSDKEELGKFYEKLGELETEEISTNWVSLPDCTPFVKGYEFKILSYYIKQHHNSILDVGCGRGVHLMYWKSKGFSVVEGCDISTIYGKGCVSRGVPFKKVDLNDEKLRLPYGSNAFDIVMSSHVLEHLKYPDIVVKELVRVAKEIVLITVPVGKSYFSKTHVHFWDTFPQLIDGLGLQDVGVFSIEVAISKPTDVAAKQAVCIIVIYKHLAGVPSFKEEFLADDIKEKVFEVRKGYDLYTP